MANVAGKPEERRKYERIRVQFKVTLSLTRGQNLGEGVLLNLSEGGCAIKSAGKVTEGVHVQLKIYPPQETLPIVVDSAAVRWVKGSEFGAEFQSVRVQEMERLRRFLEQQKQTRDAALA